MEQLEAVFDAVMAAPWGGIGVCVAGEAVVEIRYLPAPVALRTPKNLVAEETVRQIERYLADPHFAFDLPLAPAGTPFRQRVWAGISAIPCGTTTTYGALARAIGGAARAVGQACGDNPYPLVIPCHRVVGQKTLGGFAHDPESAAGFHTGIKRWLLQHEGALLC